MWAAFKAFLSGGAMTSVENIAKEWIETGTEKAEASALFIKTLDPNGLMRREISARVTFLYTVYIMVSLALIACEFFGLGEAKAMAIATTKLTDLFIPITGLFGTIVTVSFGVNHSNIKAGK